ncbi:hypothetical protein pb186bvf_000256 [Paramecium bursaria]
MILRKYNIILYSFNNKNLLNSDLQFIRAKNKYIDKHLKRLLESSFKGIKNSSDNPLLIIFSYLKPFSSLKKLLKNKNIMDESQKQFKISSLILLLDQIIQIYKYIEKKILVQI